MKNLDSSVSRDGDPFMDQLPSKRRVQVFQSYVVASLLQVSAVCGGHRHPLMEIKESPAEDAGVRDIHRSVPPAEDECNTWMQLFPMDVAIGMDQRPCETSYSGIASSAGELRRGVAIAS